MGIVKRVDRNNGDEMDMGEFNGEVFGNPFLCIYGENEPRHTKGKLVTFPLADGLKAYIRLNTSEEFNKWAKENGNDDNVYGNCVLTEEVAEHFHINPNDALGDALKIMEEEGVEVEGMADFEQNITHMHYPDELNMIKIIRAKHRSGLYGAAVLGNWKLMQRIRSEIGDFYVIPSSIHEVIAIPKALAEGPMGYDNSGDLENMVREANRTVLEPEDILSDRVYEFGEDGLKPL